MRNSPVIALTMIHRINDRWEIVWANRTTRRDGLFTFDSRDSARRWLRFTMGQATMRTLRMLLCEREFGVERLSDDELIDNVANRLSGRELLVIQHGLFVCSIGTRNLSVSGLEYLPYGGESPKDDTAHSRYWHDARRGKTLFQLMAVAEGMTPGIRQSWSPRSFTPVVTPVGEFDAIVCNVSYHFYEHGQKYGSVGLFTLKAKQYFEENRQSAQLRGGVLKLPSGTYERDGRIVTFFG